MNFKDIKLIVLDIDGTLMGKDFVISKRVKNAIKKVQEKGIIVTLATGRMYKAALPIANDLGVSVPIITNQGSLVKEVDNNFDEILHEKIKTQISKKIIKELRKQNTHINIYIHDELVCEDDNDIIKEYASKRNIDYQIVDNFNNLEEIDSTKILAINKDPKKVDKLVNYLKEKYSDILNITRSTEHFCEIVNKNVSKASAVKALLGHLNIDFKNTMAIGDQDNDKDLLLAVKYPIAMGNATENVKKIAVHTTKSVDEDGVALVLEKLLETT